MNKLSEGQEVLNSQNKPLAKARLALAAVSIAAMAAIGCGGDKFESMNGTEQDGAAGDTQVPDAATDTLSSEGGDAGKPDSNAHTDADANGAETSTPDADIPDTNTPDADTPDNATPDSNPGCDTITVSPETNGVVSKYINAGQPNNGVVMLGLKMKADCAAYALKTLKTTKEGSEGILQLNLIDGNYNQVSQDKTEDPATHQYSFEGLNQTVQDNTYYVTADFANTVQPGNYYRLSVKCPDEIEASSPKVVCQDANNGKYIGAFIDAQ